MLAAQEKKVQSWVKEEKPVDFCTSSYPPPARVLKTQSQVLFASSLGNLRVEVVQ